MIGLFKTSLTFCLVILMASPSLQAQKDRPLLADVEIQKIFIDANREKILQHYQDAAYLFREVLKKDPQNHSAAYELARMYDVLEEDALSLKAIEKAVKLAPDNIWYKDFYAQVLERNNKPGKAAEVYGELAKAYPDNEYFQFQQAFFYVKANKPEKAVIVYDKLEKKLGVNEELTRKKYTLYYGMGDNKAAIAEIEKLIKAFPEEVSYLHILAEFYAEEGNTSDAKKIYSKILRLNPQDAEAKMALADSYKNSGNHMEFLKSIEGIINKTDVGIDIKVKELIPYITLVGETNDNELKMAALSLGQALTDAHPQEAKAHSLYADMLYHAGQPRNALAHYQTTLSLDKSVFAVWEQIMYLKLETNDFNGLINTSEEAMDLFPNQAKVYYMNGIGNSSLGNHGEAANMFEQALMMSGKNSAMKYDVCNRLGIEYANLKKYDRSDKMFERALELAPDGYSVLHNYSHQLAKRGQGLQKAREMAFKANQIKPNQPLFLANLGHIHFLLKNYKEAENWLEKSMQTGGDRLPEALEVYGDILYQNGKKDKALESWKKAKDLGSSSKDLDKKINDMKS